LCGVGLEISLGVILWKLRVCVKENPGTVLKMFYIKMGKDFIVSSAEKLRFK
jgi:hypothetical protein